MSEASPPRSKKCSPTVEQLEISRNVADPMFTDSDGTLFARCPACRKKNGLQVKRSGAWVCTACGVAGTGVADLPKPTEANVIPVETTETTPSVEDERDAPDAKLTKGFYLPKSLFYVQAVKSLGIEKALPGLIRALSLARATTAKRFTDKKTGEVRVFSWANVCQTDFVLRSRFLAADRKTAAYYRTKLIEVGLVEIVSGGPGKAPRARLTAKLLDAIFRDADAIQADLENRPRQRHPASMANLKQYRKPSRKSDNVRCGGKKPSRKPSRKSDSIRCESDSGGKRAGTPTDPPKTVPKIGQVPSRKSDNVRRGSKRKNLKAKPAIRQKQQQTPKALYAADVAKRIQDARELLKANPAYTGRDERLALGILGAAAEDFHKTLKLGDVAVDQMHFRKAVARIHGARQSVVDACRRFAETAPTDDGTLDLATFDAWTDREV